MPEDEAEGGAARTWRLVSKVFGLSGSLLWTARIIEGFVTGGLWLLIATHLSVLGWNAAELALIAMVGGRALRIGAAILMIGGVGAGKFGGLSLFGGVVAVVAVVAVTVTLSRPVADFDQANSDSQAFGVRIVARHTSVPERRVPGTPTPADAGVARGTAVPVVKYLYDGSSVILAVRHDLTCPIRSVVVGTPAAGQPLPVLAVVSPSNVTATLPSGGPPRCDSDGMLAGYDAVELPQLLLTAPAGVVDVSTHRPVTLVP